jgi:hypothetical protein
VLTYQPDTGGYARIGEATELALRVFVEKVGKGGQWVAQRTGVILGWRHSFCCVPTACMRGGPLSGCTSSASFSGRFAGVQVPLHGSKGGVQHGAAPQARKLNGAP